MPIVCSALVTYGAAGMTLLGCDDGSQPCPSVGSCWTSSTWWPSGPPWRLSPRGVRGYDHKPGLFLPGGGGVPSARGATLGFGLGASPVIRATYVMRRVRWLVIKRVLQRLRRSGLRRHKRTLAVPFCGADSPCSPAGFEPLGNEPRLEAGPGSRSQGTICAKLRRFAWKRLVN